MTSRERVERAVSFQKVDKPALECNVNAVALYEHGEKIRELFRTIQGDFEPISDEKFALPGPDAFDENGCYLEYKEDEWGVTWEYRIFGIQGHPFKRPLDDWENLRTYTLPPLELLKPGSEEYLRQKKHTDTLREAGFYCMTGFTGLLERACALRRFEDVLADLTCGDEDLSILLDKLQAWLAVKIENCITLGLDAVRLGDDFGMQQTMLISPQTFRDVLKPRYRELIAPLKKAGKRVFFHSCGYILPILEDLKEIGVDAIWPQLNVYDLKEFAAYARSLGLAVTIHPERSNLLTHASPDEVRRRMYEYAELFRPQDGGSWFYLEIDNGFPYENIEAMVRVIRELRR